MARSAIGLLTDDGLQRRLAEAARSAAKARFCDSKIVPLYEAYYEEILRASG